MWLREDEQYLPSTVSSCSGGVVVFATDYGQVRPVIPHITSFKSHQNPPLLFVLFSTFSERLYKLRNISTGGFSLIFCTSCLPQTHCSCCSTGVGFPHCNSMCTSLIRFQASTVALLKRKKKLFFFIWRVNCPCKFNFVCIIILSAVTSCAKQPQMF